MKLPHPEKAIIPESKLSGYCLNINHSKGGAKARVFQSALGLTAADSEELRTFLMQVLIQGDAQLDKQNEYGIKYVIYFPMTRGKKQAIVKSVWMIENNTNFPRLVSCYIPD